MVCAALAMWMMSPDTGTLPVPVPVPAPLPAPEAASAAPEVPPAPAVSPEVVARPARDDPQSDTEREAAFQVRLEAFQADVQRAVDCDKLFDRHVEPLLRVEEALLSERLQGPEHLDRRVSLLGTYDSQLAELLEKGECP